jgi:hypothetical protein
MLRSYDASARIVRARRTHGRIMQGQPSRRP